jgi:hypothetical protein
VAFCEFQLNVDMPPLAIVVGDADRVAVGKGEVRVPVVTLLLVAVRVSAGFAVLPLALLVRVV